MTGDLVRRPSAGDLPAVLPAARRALAEAGSVADVSHLVDYGQVCRVAATRAKLGKESRDDWGEFVIDAERKAGQVLKAMRDDGTRARGSADTQDRQRDGLGKPTLVDLGVADTPVKADNRARRWQSIAELDDDEYAEMKAAIRADTEQVITEQAFIARGKHKRRVEQQRARDQERQAVQPEAATITHATWDAWLPLQPECDLLLTDPPYSTDVDDVVTFARAWLPAALAKVKPTGRAYVCIGAYPVELAAYLNAPTADLMLADMLVWTYRNTLGPSSPLHYTRNWQAILHYHGPDAAPLNTSELNEKFAVVDMNAPDGRRGERWHAWQKPDALADRLVNHASNPGDIVLDPFAGTGTFLLAAARLGRKATGCDSDLDMVAMCRRRGCA